MIRSLSLSSRAVRQLLCGSLLAGALALGAGCSDVVTYSEKSRTEGLTYYEHGQYADAAGAFRNAVNQEPRDYVSRYYLGQSMARMGNWDKATQQYLAGLDVMQTNYYGIHDREYRLLIIDGLGQSLAHSPSRTVAPLLPVSDRNTAESDQHLLKAKIARYSGDADTAITEYDRAISLNGKEASLYKDYGNYLLSISQKAKARPVLERAYVLDPEDQEVIASLRSMGVVPGPSLKNRDELVKAPLPEGPLPEVRVLTNRPETTPMAPRGGAVSNVPAQPLPFDVPWNSGTSAPAAGTPSPSPRD